MVANIKNGPTRQLVSFVGVDGSNKGGTAAINLNASTDPGAGNDSTQGYIVGSLWQNSTTGRVWMARSVSVAAAVWVLVGAVNHPGYVASNWYNATEGYGGSLNAGTAALNGKILFYPAYVRERITISALGVRISATNAGNVQAALYANAAATMRPTGNPLASTASMSTASAVNVNAAVSVQIEEGMYWWGTNIDNATATLISYNAAASAMPVLVGSSSQSVALANQVALSGLQVTQAFGTWPDVTSASFTEVAGNGNPIVQFKVGSIP